MSFGSDMAGDSASRDGRNLVALSVSVLLVSAFTVAACCLVAGAMYVGGAFENAAHSIKPVVAQLPDIHALPTLPQVDDPYAVIGAACVYRAWPCQEQIKAAIAIEVAKLQDPFGVAQRLSAEQRQACLASLLRGHAVALQKSQEIAPR